MFEKYELSAGWGKNMITCLEKARYKREEVEKWERKEDFHCTQGKKYHCLKWGGGDKKNHILGKYSPLT